MPKYTDEQKQQFAEQRAAQLQAITEKLEQGISDVYSSENYADYLKTMSKFTHYSVRNTILIHMQRPDATLVAGYDAWAKKFKRHVKRGEKGIKIYAPVIRKRQQENEQDQAEPKAAQLPDIPEDVIEPQDGVDEGNQTKKYLAAFKIQNVFDISQTDGEPIAEVTPKILDSDMANFDHFLDALIQTAGIPVYFKTIEGSANGYFNRVDNEIVVRNDMPEMQTAKTLIHEIAHSRLHAIKDGDLKKAMSELPQQHIRELQADSTAYVVMAHYGFDAGEFTFPYVAMWAQDRDLTELRENLELIRSTASTLIDEIDAKLNEIELTQSNDLDMDEELSEQHVSEDNPRPYRYFITEESLQNGTFPQQENMLVTETPQKQFYENDTVEAYGFIDYAEPLTMKELEQHHLVPSDENPPPPVVEAAYSIGNGDYLEVHLADEGWMFTLYDKNFTEVDGGCFTDPQTIEEAKGEALANYHLENAVTRPIDREEFQKRLDLIEEHNLSAAVLPYIMEQDGGNFKLDTNLEPVVTIVESTHPTFREGMKLPLHLADRITSEVDAEMSRKNRGKGANAVTSSVVCRIDYKVKDTEHHHHETLNWGRKNGGLMLSMERNANGKISRFTEHPEEGNRGAWQTFVEAHIPVMYQQSMKAENQILNQLLPKPSPFYNMTMQEGTSDPNVGMSAIATSHAVTQSCKKAMDAELENASHHKAVYQFLNRMCRQFGKERVQAVLSATVQHKDYDGRFHSDVKEFAAQMPLKMGKDSFGHDLSMNYVLNSHSVIVDNAVRAFRKMTTLQRDSEKKPSIRRRLANSKTEQKTDTKQREKTQKRSTEHGI